MPSVAMLSVINPENHSDECHYVKQRRAEHHDNDCCSLY
jgi:hypothetical protein